MSPTVSSAPAVTDLVAGQIPVAVVDLTSAHPHIKAGTLIALGVPHVRRTALAPDIPTIAEAGVAGFGRIAGFIGLFAPAGTPAPVVKRYSQEVASILSVPEVRDKVRLLSVEPAYEDDVTFARVLAENRNGESFCNRYQSQTSGVGRSPRSLTLRIKQSGRSDSTRLGGRRSASRVDRPVGRRRQCRSRCDRVRGAGSSPARADDRRRSGGRDRRRRK